MAQASGIEWTDATWNPSTGCSKVSTGCKYCYAESMAARLKRMGSARYDNGFDFTMHWDLVVERADHLRATPASIRFLSCEPLLGPLDELRPDRIDWVIVGGESGQHLWKDRAQRRRGLVEYLDGAWEPRADRRAHSTEHHAARNLANISDRSKDIPQPQNIRSCSAGPMRPGGTHHMEHAARMAA